MSANLVYYSLDGTIEQFFQDETATRQECDDLAVSLLGSPVRPMPIQGLWSYTVAGLSTDSLVQSRKETAALDMELVKRARDTYGAFVADCMYHGPVGQSPSLLVYVMEKLPGEPYIHNRPKPKDGLLSPAEESRTVATVMGFARFFALSWKNPQTLPESAVRAIRQECDERVDLLIAGLPPRFTDKLRFLQSKLASLFAATDINAYPLVLSHGDLCEMNILTDPDTGRVTGVIDWEDCRILPFGVSLWGLENALGWMDSGGWHYYPNRDALVRIFWQTFDTELAVGNAHSEMNEAISTPSEPSNSVQNSTGPAKDSQGAATKSSVIEGQQNIKHSCADREKILVARLLGIFYRYGFDWGKGDRVTVSCEAAHELRYLDALVNTSL